MSNLSLKAFECRSVFVVVFAVFCLLRIETVNRTVGQFIDYVEVVQKELHFVSNENATLPETTLTPSSADNGIFSHTQTIYAILNHSNAEVRPLSPANLTIISLWQQRFGSVTNNETQPRKYIFFKHIRKAGGTFIREYLANVRRYHPDAATPKGEMKGPPNRQRLVAFAQDLSDDPTLVSYYEQEFAAMDWQCSEFDPRWNLTISITALREPISRQISEFFYSGLRDVIRRLNETKDGRANSLLRLYEQEKYTPDFYQMLDEYLPMWVGDHRGGDDKEDLGRAFYNNFQVRAFSGQVHPGERQKITNKRNLPCAYDMRVWGGGTPASGTVNEERLRKAMLALSKFDVVLTAETMSQQAEMVADLLGVPTDVTSLSKTKDSVVANSHGKDTGKKAKLVDEIAIHSPDVFALLQNVSYFESQFYAYAVTLNQERFDKWKIKRGGFI